MTHTNAKLIVDDDLMPVPKPAAPVVRLAAIDGQATPLAPSPASRPWLSARTLDAIEKGVIAIFFMLFFIRMVPHIDDARPANLIVFISECVITAFALCHRPTEQISRVPSEWLLAISVSFMPTLIAPMEESSNFPVAISVGLMTFGFLLATTAKLFLARSFGVVPANRGVCARGPYMFVRHPVYAGYFITYIGFLTAYPAAWNLFVYGLVGVLQIRRILAEEALLSQDRAYQDYKRTVPYRLLPGLF